MTPVPEYNATRIETEQRHPSPKADTEVKFGNRVIVVIESTEKSVDVSGGAGVLKKLYPYSVNGCRFEVLDKKLGASAVISSDSCISIQHEGIEDEPELDAQTRERLSQLFTKGYWKLARYADKNGVEEVGGNCHMLANYLGFGLTDYSDDSLPYAEFYKKLSKNDFVVLDINASEFDESMLCPGDLLQMFGEKGIFHSIFYIGAGKYLNCYGYSNIYIQSFEGVTASCELDHCHALKIIRKKDTGVTKWSWARYVFETSLALVTQGLKAVKTHI